MVGSCCEDLRRSKLRVAGVSGRSTRAIADEKNAKQKEQLRLQKRRAARRSERCVDQRNLLPRAARVRHTPGSVAAHAPEYSTFSRWGKGGQCADASSHAALAADNGVTCTADVPWYRSQSLTAPCACACGGTRAQTRSAHMKIEVLPLLLLYAHLPLAAAVVSRLQWASAARSSHARRAHRSRRCATPKIFLALTHRAAHSDEPTTSRCRCSGRC